MSSSASSTERKTERKRSTKRRSAESSTSAAAPRTSTRLERAVARLLVASMIGMTPGGALASDAFPSADGAQMLTPGSIDQSEDGLTRITSQVEDGATYWSEGLDLGAGHTLQYDLLSDDSTHWNHVGGDFAAHLNGTIVSGPEQTIVFSSPFGVFIGSEAILDVGTLVAVGADVLNHDFDVDGPVLEITGAIENQGLIQANADVLLYGTRVRNSGEIRAENGHVLLLGAEALDFFNADTVAESLVNPLDYVAVMGSGEVENAGLIAALNASLLGGRVENQGRIEIADGSLMMLGADAVYVSQFDNPVLIRLPHATASNDAANDDGEVQNASLDTASFRVENQGQIDAGLGHVRLAAADPLGWGIRQGSGGTSETESAPSEPAIFARTIEIEGGQEGRVELSGRIDASNLAAGAEGGTIDVTGSILAISDATIDASGSSGGGTIQIGGEQQGRGELQRARALVMDDASSVRADAIGSGDGGRVILFSEDLTSVDGAVSARGGAVSGDGGFIETSGLRHFAISQTPDATAPNGLGGEWLIDPYAIRILAAGAAPDCDTGTASCLNRAVEAILSPNFDSAAFDGVLRGVAPNNGIASPNDLSVDLLVAALARGTSVTLSTEAFDTLDTNPGMDPNVNPDEGVVPMGGTIAAGDISVEAPIEIRNGEALPGTSATLTLLAAGSIHVNQDITVRDAADTTTSDHALSIVLRANDQAQRAANKAFGNDQLAGGVNLNADIRTGGGDFSAFGLSVDQAVGTALETDGGNVEITAGSILTTEVVGAFTRNPNDATADALPTASLDPSLRIAGTIDTSRQADDPGNGGSLSLFASGIQIDTTQSGNNLLSIDPGLIAVSGTLMSGGGDIRLDGGARDSRFAGSVELTNATIDSAGGDVLIDANRVDANSDNSTFDVDFVDDARGEGGSIVASGVDVRTSGGLLQIGSNATQSISLDGDFDTTDASDDEDGLIAVVALDTAGLDTTEGRFGRSAITLGENQATSLRSAGIALRARDIATGPNGVTLVAEGDSSAELFEAEAGIGTGLDSPDNPPLASVGAIAFTAEHRLDLAAGTSANAERIRIDVATEDPTRLNGAETNGVGQMLAADANDAAALTRLTFGGTGGASAAAGVRLAADDIAIDVGDGTTATDGLGFEALVEDGTATPNTLGLLRGTGGDYAGLQLRSRDDANARPEILSIRQDADLTISQAAPTGPGEIFLGGRSGSGSTTGAFAAATIGAAGQTVTLEASDGTLTLEDAAALSDDLAATPTSDLGASWVTLHGGLLLDDMAGATPADSIVLFDPLVSGSAFDARGLDITTPRDLTLTDAFARAIGLVADLVLEAGRDPGIDPDNVNGNAIGDAARDGTLTIEEGVFLRASERLSLHAGASGFGDLVFETSMPMGTPTRLAADAIELRAGAGRDTLNTDTTNRSEIQGLAAVEIRDSADTDFVSDATNALSFSVRQDAAIDAGALLPTFDNFTTTTISSFDGAGAATPVAYSVRSDFGGLDLRTDATDGARFTDAALSLVGLDLGPGAILVDDDFSFVGPSIELGSTNGFVYTTRLAEIFNPTGVPAEARERVTLRAALGGSGTLSFGNTATVTAGEIALIASDGVDGDTLGRIAIGGGLFDLSSAAPGERTFVFQEDEGVQFSDLPTDAQWVGGRPNILALRSDGGTIAMSGFDVTELRTDFFDALSPARLILEADTIELTDVTSANLVLSDAGTDLALRLRANTLRLDASIAGSETGTGRVLAGARPGDTTTAVPTSAADATFDGESLLIEAFDPEREIASTTNLSSASQALDDPALVNLSTGRGPTTLSIIQDGAVTPDELPNRFAISGYLTRGLEDDADGAAIRTDYDITSAQGSITLGADNVSGSNLFLGQALVPLDQDITFETGVYDFGSVGAFTSESITVATGITMNAEEAISLAAALIGPEPTVAIDDGANRMGDLVFEGSGTSLSANRIQLTAGPAFVVSNPDGTNDATDGERDVIPPSSEATPGQGGLSRVLLGGLATLTRTGDREGSRFFVQASDDFEARSGAADSDVITPLVAGSAGGSNEWDTVELVSTQGTLTLAGTQAIADTTRNLTLGRAFPDARVVIETAVADPLSVAAGFEEQVRIESNDLSFVAADGIELRLDTPNLRLVGSTFLSSNTAPDELATISDLTADELSRAIVRISQNGDFSTTRLIRADRLSRVAFDPFTGEFSEVPRESLSQIDIALTTRGDNFVLGNSIRDTAFGSNLIISAGAGMGPNAAADVRIDLVGLPPGFTFDDFAADDLQATDHPALVLSSLDIDSGDGAGTITIGSFSSTTAMPGVATAEDLTLETVGDQRFHGRTVLEETLSTDGRDIRFTGPVYRDASSSNELDAGLVIQTAGEVFFEGDLGTSSGLGLASDVAERLGKLWVLFDSDATRTPSVQFGQREDNEPAGDPDGFFETPVASDQFVLVDGATVFATADLNEPGDPQDANDGDLLEDLADALDAVTTATDLASVLSDFGLGREALSPYATIGKASGDLTFLSGAASPFVMGSGERLAVGGRVTIDHGVGLVSLGDVAATDIDVTASAILLVLRNSGATFLPNGSSTQDAGPSILANTIDFGGAPLSAVGSGKLTRFGVPNPFDPALDPFFGDFPLFANRPNGGMIDASFFRFVGGGDLSEQVPSLLPLGASRSELSGAFGPEEVATPPRDNREAPPLRSPQRLIELAVDSRDTPSEVQLARLRGAAIIDDLRFAPEFDEEAAAGDARDVREDEARVVVATPEDRIVSVTGARLDAKDAEEAIALYERLFGPEGERADEVRDVLQHALDQYLETTRARRVIGFELRRFVKNRPSSLLEAYTTLDQLDALFRYHRRLGLSPGEFRRIQAGWLEQIQPDGITLDELAEAIHPSRYVRGSDILDIFGR